MKSSKSRFITLLLLSVFILSVFNNCLESGKSKSNASDNQDIQLPPHPLLFFSKGEELSVLKKTENNVLLKQLIDYADEAVSVTRGFKLLSPKTVLLKDEIVLKPGGKEVSWRFITNAEVKINENTATLSQNGKMFYIRCLLTNGFQLNVFPAKPYSKEEKPINNVNIVEITRSASGKLLEIPVLLSNKMDEYVPVSDLNMQLTDWK